MCRKCLNPDDHLSPLPLPNLPDCMHHSAGSCVFPWLHPTDLRWAHNRHSLNICGMSAKKTSSTHFVLISLMTSHYISYPCVTSSQIYLCIYLSTLYFSCLCELPWIKSYQNDICYCNSGVFSEFLSTIKCRNFVKHIIRHLLI